MGRRSVPGGKGATEEACFFCGAAAVRWGACRGCLAAAIASVAWLRFGSLRAFSPPGALIEPHALDLWLQPGGDAGTLDEVDALAVAVCDLASAMQAPLYATADVVIHAVLTGLTQRL